MSDPVVSTDFPYLPLTLVVRDRTEHLTALLDTGFTGYVVVPEGFLKNGHRPDGSAVWQLGDGSYVRASYYHGTVQIGTNPPIIGTITELGSEPIVGRSITDRFKITLDHGERVVVEP